MASKRIFFLDAGPSSSWNETLNHILISILAEKRLLLETHCTSVEKAWAAPLFCTMSCLCITLYLMTEYWLRLLLAGEAVCKSSSIMEQLHASNHNLKKNSLLRCCATATCFHCNCHAKLEGWVFQGKWVKWSSDGVCTCMHDQAQKVCVYISVEEKDLNFFCALVHKSMQINVNMLSIWRVHQIHQNVLSNFSKN